MIQRGQVYVRAQDRHGRWHSADALDLDEESFRRYMLTLVLRMTAAGAPVPRDETPLRTVTAVMDAPEEP